MDVKVVSSFAEPIGRTWIEAQKDSVAHHGNFLVAAPLSSTPLPIYQWIIKNSESFPNWEQVRFVLMDEQVEGTKPPFHYIAADDPASYENFARQHFLTPLSQKTSHAIPVIKPDLNSIDAFELSQPIDLLLLALGPQGNYANVMPMTPRHAGWHVAKLLPEFQEFHTHTESASYAGARFREFGMSLGHQQALNARKIVVIASGEKKRALVSSLGSFDHFNPVFPLSIIHDPYISSRVTVYLTEDIGDSWPPSR